MPEIQAVAVEGVRSQLTADGKMGLLYFQRIKPGANGSRELNIAVPTPLLPYVAVSAMEAVAQIDRTVADPPGAPAFVMQARSAGVALSRDGLMVLTIELDMGARINFSIDAGQAESLQRAVSVAVGRQKAQALRAQAPPRNAP